MHADQFSEMLTMNRVVVVALAASVVFASASSWGGEQTSAASFKQIDSYVEVLVGAQNRALGRAVAFCEDGHQPEGRSAAATYQSFVKAFSSGMRAAWIEIANVDSESIRQAPALGAEDLKMMDQQGSHALERVRASPVAECERLVAFLAAVTEDGVKKQAIQGYGEYQVRREQYCAQVPRPKTCN